MAIKVYAMTKEKKIKENSNQILWEDFVVRNNIKKKF